MEREFPSGRPQLAGASEEGVTGLTSPSIHIVPVEAKFAYSGTQSANSKVFTAPIRYGCPPASTGINPSPVRATPPFRYFEATQLAEPSLELSIDHPGMRALFLTCNSNSIVMG